MSLNSISGIGNVYSSSVVGQTAVQSATMQSEENSFAALVESMKAKQNGEPLSSSNVIDDGRLRGGNKTINESLVFGISCFFFQPFAELFYTVIKIYTFTNKNTNGKTKNHHHCSVAGEMTVLYHQHLFQSTCDTEKDHAHTVCFH